MRAMSDSQERLRLLESEIERRLVERFAALRDEFDRLRVESDRRWAGFLGRFEQDFRGIVPPELVAEPEPPPAPAPAESGLPDRPSGAGLLSIEVARNLDDAGNQVEALHRFLELCRRHASRAALLIAKGDSFSVWKATGFSDHGGNDEAARRVTLPLDGGALARVIEGAPYRLDAGNDLSSRLGSDASAAVLVPMVVKEKVSGAVYADTTADEASRFDPESIAFLTFLAGLFVDRLAARKLKPAPSLRPLGTFDAAASHAPAAAAVAPAPPPVEEAAPDDSERPSVSAPEPAPPRKPRDSYGTQILSPEESAAIRRGAAGYPEPEPEPEPGKKPTPEFVEEPPARSASAGAEEPSLQYEADEEPARSDMYQPAPSSDMYRPAASAPAPEPAPPPEPPPVAPVVPPRPAPSGRRLAGPLAPLEGDERREEARRFAKLLVSEIKLYNEKAVQEGRQRGDIYERLKEDIDRSRQMYDERIPEDVRSSSNFFYEELVRILADGRAEALGI